jgi:hypothetical protein
MANYTCIQNLHQGIDYNFFQNEWKASGHGFKDLHYLIVKFGTIFKVIENAQWNMAFKIHIKFKL